MPFIKKGFQTLALPREWILLKRAKLGEKEAFGKLYEIYMDRIYRYNFFRVGQDRFVAEDLTADVFVKAWEKLDKFDKGSFQAWIYTIARNTIIDYMRTGKKHKQLDETVIDEKIDIEEEVHKKLGVEKILSCLDDLTEEQREIIILRFVNDMSYKDIAALLKKQEDAIRALQYRALKQLKKILKEK